MARQRGNEPERNSRRRAEYGQNTGRNGYGQNAGRNGRAGENGRRDSRMMGARPPRRPGRVFTVGNLLTALVGFLFIVSLSVVLVLNLRSIYYFDIRYQQLEQKTGLSEEVIRENYDTLIDYNLITKRVKTLEFPDFPMSEHGEIHFAEVKRIFVFVQYLCIIMGILFVVSIVRRLRRRELGWLKLTSVITLAAPVILIVLAVFNWDAFFVKFHELFFDNYYWIFDPATDPVINILPDEFFYHCAVVILLFVLLGGIFTGALYRLTGGRRRRER